MRSLPGSRQSTTVTTTLLLVQAAYACQLVFDYRLYRYQGLSANQMCLLVSGQLIGLLSGPWLTGSLRARSAKRALVSCLVLAAVSSVCKARFPAATVGQAVAVSAAVALLDFEQRLDAVTLWQVRTYQGWPRFTDTMGVDPVSLGAATEKNVWDKRFRYINLYISHVFKELKWFPLLCSQTYVIPVAWTMAAVQTELLGIDARRVYVLAAFLYASAALLVAHRLRPGTYQMIAALCARTSPTTLESWIDSLADYLESYTRLSIDVGTICIETVSLLAWVTFPALADEPCSTVLDSLGMIMVLRLVRHALLTSKLSSIPCDW